MISLSLCSWCKHGYYTETIKLLQVGLFQKKTAHFQLQPQKIVQLPSFSLPKDKVICLLYLTSFKSLISFSDKDKTVKLWGRQTGARRSEVIIFPCSNRIYKVKTQQLNECLIKTHRFPFQASHDKNTYKRTISKAFWSQLP